MRTNQSFMEVIYELKLLHTGIQVYSVHVWKKMMAVLCKKSTEMFLRSAGVVCHRYTEVAIRALKLTPLLCVLCVKGQSHVLFDIECADVI